jgi:EAL domain-containing protein (putative c-di-GMP-specific phosphodiesterase class I)
VRGTDAPIEVIARLLHRIFGLLTGWQAGVQARLVRPGKLVRNLLIKVKSPAHASRTQARRRVVLATALVADKLALENQLREAIDKEEFVLHYQPKVNLVSGKVTSAEALIRWNNPRTGLVPPAMFIPILEETGLINEVGRWALHKAMEDYLRWRAADLPAVRIAVNVSSLQLRNTNFMNEIRRVTSLDARVAQGLELEITESLIMEDVQHSVDTLKIDRAFVIEMDTPQGLALVSTIIILAHALKLKVWRKASKPRSNRASASR